MLNINFRFVSKGATTAGHRRLDGYQTDSSQSAGRNVCKVESELLVYCCVLAVCFILTSCIKPLQSTSKDEKKSSDPIEKSVVKESAAKKSTTEETLVVVQESENEFSEVLKDLKQGRYDIAKDELAFLLNDPEFVNRQGAEYYLGILKLFEMDGLTKLKSSKKYFEDYSRKYPDSEFNANAATIVRLLKNQLSIIDEKQAAIDELNETIEKQAEEIKTLTYQIKKLEEIQQEIETKRHSLQLE